MSARRRPAPPSGQPPPRRVALADGTDVDLEALATEICACYREEFPDEHERYGEAGHLWCLHDNQHLLNWAVLDVAGLVSLDEQAAWLAKVLEARDFPLDRLARSLELCGEIAAERIDDAVAGRLADAAAFVRSRGTFLEPR